MSVKAQLKFNIWWDENFPWSHYLIPADELRMTCKFLYFCLFSYGPSFHMNLSLIFVIGQFFKHIHEIFVNTHRRLFLYSMCEYVNIFKSCDFSR